MGGDLFRKKKTTHQRRVSVPGAGAIWALALEGQTMAAACEDGTLRLFSLAEGRRQRWWNGGGTGGELRGSRFPTNPV